MDEKISKKKYLAAFRHDTFIIIYTFERIYVIRMLFLDFAVKNRKSYAKCNGLPDVLEYHDVV